MQTTNQESISSRGWAFARASLLVVCLISAFATTTHADALANPTDAVARKHLVTGNRYYRVLRDFEKAIEEYQAGALKEDAPVFSYNLGQCYRRLGRYEDAIWHYERFLERGRPTGGVEASVRKFIAEMKGELEKKAMTQPIQPAAPAAAPTISASSGQILPADPPAEDLRGSQRKVAVGIGVAGVAVMGLGIGLGLRAQLIKSDAAEVCPTNPCARSDEANELIDRGQANALYANVAFSVGGAAILGAAVLWITGSHAERKPKTIMPQVSRAFTGVAAFLRF